MQLCENRDSCIYSSSTVATQWNTIILGHLVDVKNFAAFLHKLNKSCLENLYDVQKSMLIEKSFHNSISLWRHCQPCILSSLCAIKMTSSADPSKMVNNWKTKPGIKNFDKRLHHSIMLFTGINKNFTSDHT